MGKKLKTVLVTGAGGYIGSVATYLLLQKGYKVLALDNFSRGYREPLDVLQKKYGNLPAGRQGSGLQYYDADINDNLDHIFKEHKIDAVFHYAALCLVNESMEMPGRYFENNVCGTLNLLQTLNKHKVTKLVFSSTCATYGKAQKLPITEDTPTNPTNPYGESKLLTEKMIRWFGDQLGLRYAILRYFNVCGASDDGLIGDSKKPSQLLMQNAVRGALGIDKFELTCPTVDTPDGTPIRDYVNVVDLNEAHIAALKYLSGGGESQIINIGTGTGNSVLEIVDTVSKVTGKELESTKGEARKGEDAKLFADITKAKNILGWKPVRSIEDSINSLVAWYNEKPRGWKK